MADITASGNLPISYDGVSNPWIVRQTEICNPFIGGCFLIPLNDGNLEPFGNLGVFGYGPVSDLAFNLLEIDNGSVVISEAGSIGSTTRMSGSHILTDGHGAVVIKDPGSQWINHGRLTVAAGSDDASLDVLNGAYVNSAEGAINQTGIVTISGAGSTWYNENGLEVNGGSIKIENGARLSNSVGIFNYRPFNSSFIDYSSYLSLSGSVTISGAGSVWENRQSNNPTPYDRLYIDGSVLIEDGARLETVNTFVRFGFDTQNITVTGTGSTWENQNNIFVSNRLTVSDGAKVVTKTSTFDNSEVLIDGSGSELTIQESALVFGGRLSIVNQASVSGNGSYSQRGRRSFSLEEGVQYSGLTTVNGILAFDGVEIIESKINGNGDINANNVSIINSSIEVGDNQETDIFTINGDLSLINSILEIDITSTEEINNIARIRTNSSDVLQVSGTTTIERSFFWGGTIEGPATNILFDLTEYVPILQTETYTFLTADEILFQGLDIDELIVTFLTSSSYSFDWFIEQVQFNGGQALNLTLVNSVPLPAAFWLMSFALLGLIPFKACRCSS